MQSVINLFAIVCVIILVFAVIKKAKAIVHNIKEAKKRRIRQKQRLRSCRNGYRPAPILIAKEFAAEIEKAAPLRKATGYFSDADAQALIK